MSLDNGPSNTPVGLQGTDVGRIMSIMADEVPDIYADSVEMALTPYDAVLEFSKRTGRIQDAAKTQAVHVGTVRMSLQHAKVLAILLKKNLSGYESVVGTIDLHPDLLKALGVSKSEDW